MKGSTASEKRFRSQLRQSRALRLLLRIAFLYASIDVRAQSNGSWQGLASLPTARQELATAALNGKIYALGGYDMDGRSTAIVEVYDPATNAWSSAHAIPSLTNHNAAAVAAGKLYSINGSATHVYDLAADSWSSVATAHFPHTRTPAVGVFEDKIYVAGGFATASTRDLEVYDPFTNSWTVRAPMNVARNHTGGAFIEGKFYVVGGRGSTGAETALEVYDPQTNAWRSLPPMPTGRSGIAVAAVQGELFVFGGEAPVQAEVEAYNPATNTWRRLPDMPNPRHGIWASVIGSRVYLAGGAYQEGFGASDVNDVFTAESPSARFANISTRGRVETGDHVLIGGFIVNGQTSKRVLVRAPGPSVPVPVTLADTTLELYDNAGRLLASNDNWADAPNAQEIIDSTLAPRDAREAAILTRVAPGASTVIVRGVNGSSGVALVEVYDLDPSSEAKLANVSTRGFVQTGDKILIGGLIINGSDALRVILRARGPSLPIAGALANPTLEVRDGNGALLASNDDWRNSTQEAEIIATTLAPPSGLESASIQTLSPGAYTALVRGVDESSGTAHVEAYALR